MRKFYLCHKNTTDSPTLTQSISGHLQLLLPGALQTFEDDKLALSLLDQKCQHPAAAWVTLCIGAAAGRQGDAGDSETCATEQSVLQKRNTLHSTCLK